MQKRTLITLKPPGGKPAQPDPWRNARAVASRAVPAGPSKRAGAGAAGAAGTAGKIKDAVAARPGASANPSVSQPTSASAAPPDSSDAAADPAPKLRPGAHPDSKAVLQPAFLPDLKPDSLALCLLGAANAVAQVRAGSALPQALAKVFVLYSASAQTRGAMQDLAYRAMRRLGLCQALIGLMTSKAPEPPMLHALLCCALSLVAGPADGGPYEEFTVVDQAVTLAASHPDMAHAKGMVNAVLRRFLRERAALMAAALRQPEAAWNYPVWWIDAAKAAYPQDWQAILMAGNAPPPLTLRVNRRKGSVAAYLLRLEGCGMAATQIGPDAVRLAQPVPVNQIPGFAQGLVSVQDAGAQMAAQLLDARDGMRVLDACAAPGGKACHLLECADLDLTALDSDSKRLPRVAENLERLGLAATLKAFDAQSRVWWDGQPFDRILADVPCTASGIVRRHPDIRWLRRKGDIHQLATLSGRILDNLWQMLRADGKLLFVTCSLWPQESEAQAAAFAVRHNAIRLPAPGQLLPSVCGGQDHDGLFYALFQKGGH